MNDIVCFIPARLNSTRLPNKVLKKINNETIISRVVNKVKNCKLINKIIVLTDNNLVKDEIKNMHPDIRCEIIKEYCENGTERIINFLNKNLELKNNIIVNVQGDEPFINPENIDKCILNYLENINNKNIKCSTLIYKIKDNPKLRNIVKVVLDKNNNILYGSRNLIPGTKYTEENNNIDYIGHIGIFVYDYKYLVSEFKNNKNILLQKSEDIEWLKILEDGYKINAILVEKPERSVDTLDDYIYLLNKYKKT